MLAPERPEQVLRGFGLAVVAVVEQADQRREAERAGHQHALVVALVGVLADRDEIADRGLELLLGEFHLAGEVVQVAHERRHDLLEPRVGRALQFGQYGFGDVFLVLDDHGAPKVAIACEGRSPRSPYSKWRRSLHFAIACCAQGSRCADGPPPPAGNWDRGSRSSRRLPGIGRRNDSAAHQQSPPGLQSKPAPQRAQVTRLMQGGRSRSHGAIIRESRWRAPHYDRGFGLPHQLRAQRRAQVPRPQSPQ